MGTDSPHPAPWRDTTVSPEQRVEYLISDMTLEEKLAQLYGVWAGASTDGGEVAPYQSSMSEPADLDTLLPLGLGQVTRPFGTRPVDPAIGALSLMRTQQRIASSNRHGIPALAHDECLAGFAAWNATAYPVPLSWAATFNPPLIETMGHHIGRDMRHVGVHQGLAPVLDVVRDPRWGRVEETMGEDPHLVSVTATAYVKGVESAGVVATLKHFAGYSASKAARNLAPVSMGPREYADVILPPFEMAVRDAKPRSVMSSYTDIDGVPSTGDEWLLTDLLRNTWGFEGTVVADYFAIAFLHKLHGTAANLGEAAAQALRAGVDVELPNPHTFLEPAREAVANGTLSEDLIDRALRRVLLQKLDLGLLDPDWDPTPAALQGKDLDDVEALRGTITLDPEDNRELARQIAEQAVILLSNDGTLPIAPNDATASGNKKAPKTIAVIGPSADFEFAVLGCYSFPAHIGVRFEGTPTGIRIPTLLEALQDEFGAGRIVHVPGTTLDGGETDGFDAAVAAARNADLVIMALGDRAGLFGQGTSGEGCDAANLKLPAAQGELLEAVLDVGTPTVVTLLAGKAYALGTAPQRAAAIVQTFFPGEEGTPALAGVLSGRVNPSGRLPLSVPAQPDGQPWTYLSAPLAQKSGVSNIDPTPAYAFGHGLTYTTFEWSEAKLSADSIATDGTTTVSLTVTNTGKRAGADVVQLYVHQSGVSMVRPVQRLIGFARVELDPGQSATVTFEVSMDLLSFTNRALQRVVEPGAVVLGLGHSAADIPVALDLQVTGEVREVDHTRALQPAVRVG